MSEEQFSRTIAIDGPAASGKSVLAEKIAARVGYFYLDTGLMYRAVTNEAIRRGIPIADEAAVTRLAEAIVINVLPQSQEADGHAVVTVDGREVSGELKTPQVDRNVSAVAAYAGVRQVMVEQQRRIAERGKIVMAGRDIGTVVLPDAGCKIFLTASVEARARRRMADRTARGQEVTFEAMRDEISKRDAFDSSRDVAPLRPADDAVYLDNSDLTIDETVERVLTIMHKPSETLAAS